MLPPSSGLKVETALTSVTLVSYHNTTQRHDPGTLKIHIFLATKVTQLWTNEV